MSLTEKTRDKIRKYILESMFNGGKDIPKKTAENFGISKQTAYKYMRGLIEEGSAKRIGNGKYEIVQTVDEQFVYSLKEKKLEEDIIFEETLQPYIKGFDDNTYRIWQYAFTEMVNNAIDHSDARKMKIYIGQNALSTWVNILDNGIGIFKKISDYYNYETLDDAIISLFKGKLTTDNQNHSGEGIFFTSKAMDYFGAISSNRLFEQSHTHEKLRALDVGNYSPKIESYKDWKGTLIVMALTNEAKRTLKEVFDMYSSVDGGFTVTSIPMNRICDSGYPVSRSQAKRLYFGFDKFERIILDFQGVDEIGQGFAHELFNVFQKKHPEIKMECINVNDEVQKMISRVKKG